MKKNSLLPSLIIFVGSVFLVYSKFVNSENSPKFYFAVLSCLFVLLVEALLSKRVNLFSTYRGVLLFLGIFIICFLQAIYGIFQYYGWLASKNPKFAITGSFDNPAGFAAVMAMAIPVGLFLYTNSHRRFKVFPLVGLLTITLVVVLSGSRAGLLAIIVSSVLFLLIQFGYSVFEKGNVFLAFLSIGVFIALSVYLYSNKKNSANGRLLIWRISYSMIEDKPLFGHGYGSFRAKYMDYQAAYFKNYPNSKYRQLADNVKHPFNEFIKLAVEFGLVGVTVLIVMVIAIFQKVKNTDKDQHALITGGFVAFFVLASFSYPLKYVAVWILLGFYLFSVFPEKGVRIKNNPFTMLGRIFIASICCILFVHFLKQANNEIRWKDIASQSLRGKTLAMLPEYEKLYPKLRSNPYFLYNYGAELNVAKKYDESILKLKECQKRFNDYDLQMILADNYYNNADFEQSIKTYKYAAYMIPCRFLPLHRILEIYKEKGLEEEALQYANEIIQKEVKIPSYKVSLIVMAAEDYLNERRYAK